MFSYSAMFFFVFLVDLQLLPKLIKKQYGFIQMNAFEHLCKQSLKQVR